MSLLEFECYIFVAYLHFSLLFLKWILKRCISDKYNDNGNMDMDSITMEILFI